MNRVLTIARIVWLEMIRRKDVYVLLILLVSMLFLLLSLNIFGLGGVVRYVTDVGLMFTWLFSIILVVNAAGRQLPQEETKRTIHALLAKPVTRAELIAGKWLGSWTVAMACTAIFYLLIVLVVRARGGSIHMVSFAQALILHFAALGVLAALAIAVSTRLTYGAAATVAFIFTAGSLAIAPRVPEFLVHEEGLAAAGLMILYYAMPHLELFDLRMRVVHDWGVIPAGTLGFVLAYGVVWVLLLLLLAWLGYRNKRFKRGAAG